MSKTATFETGTNGNTIATSDTGSADAWNNVVIGANVTAKYDTAHPAHGSLGAKFVAGASAGVSYLEWTGLNLTGTYYNRTYFLYTGTPSVGVIIAAAYRASDSTVGWDIKITTAGKILLDGGAGGSSTAATALSTNTLYRIEWSVTVGLSTNGAITAKVYLGDGTTEQTALGTSLTGINTRSVNDWFRIGFPVTAPSAFTWWCDDVVAGAATWPGPSFATVTGAAALTGTGSIVAAGTRTRLGAAALAGTGTISAAGVRTRLGAAALAGTGSLAASGTGTAIGAAALSGAGTLAASGTRTRFGQATLAGTGTLAAAGSHQAYGSAALQGLGSLSTNGTRTRIGSATLSGAGTLTASGLSSTVGAASLTGLGTLTAVGVAARVGQAALAGIGALTAAGTRIVLGLVTLEGDGTLTASGTAHTPLRTRATGGSGRTAIPDDNSRTRATAGVRT